MKEFIRLLKADCQKMKHTAFYRTHLIFPLIGILIFIGYYSYTPWNSVSKIAGYLEVIGIAFPFMGALVTTMVIEVEAEAGGFKEMLCMTCSRNKIFISKLLFLLLAAAFSTVLAIGGFYLGFYYGLGETQFKFGFYIKAAGIMLLAQVVMYCFHMILCLKTGKGITIGVGIVESLLAALLQLDLGVGKWQFIPCSWGARLSDYYINTFMANDGIYKSLKNERIVMAVVAVVVVVFSLKAFYDYEGRKEIEL